MGAIDDTLLARVDEPTREALITLRDYEPETEVDLTTRLALTVIDAAGFGDGRTLIPLPEELTETQRAVAHFLAGFDRRFGGRAIPDQPWKVRRWLGLEGREPGVLERVVTIGDHTEPLWRALLRAKLARGDGKALVRSLGLSTAEQLEVFTDVYFGAYNLRRPREPWVSTTAINGSFGDWARNTADRLLEGRHGTTDQLIRVPVTLALVRAGVPIEPRWEPLMFAGEALVPLMEECFATLPDERRDQALVNAIRSAGFASDKIRTARAMMGRWPSAALTELIVSCADHAAGAPKHSRITKTQLKKMMKHVSEREPEVGRVWKAYLAGRPTPIALERVSSVVLSASDDLDPFVMEQIEAAGVLYDGRTMSAEERLSADPDDEWSFNGRLELRKLRERASEKEYDAFLVQPDTATVFAGGTTDEVACMIQGGVECADEALRDALREALR